MNIYEEAIEALSSNTYETDDSELKIIKALERAKKVEELLGLKDDKISLISKYVNSYAMSWDTNTTSKLSIIYGKTKKLEKELEEMK